MTQTRIIEAKSAAQVICVVVHGRGQTQDDMMQAIVTHLDLPNVRFVMPKSEGAGWYAARAIDPLTDECRAELAGSLAQLAMVIDTAVADAPGLPVFLVGFSQGACLAVEYLMQHGALNGAAALLTGCRVGTRHDALPMAELGGMPIYATDGDKDPWIPAEAYFEMLGDLTKAGARIRMDMFPGRPHAVDSAEIAVLRTMLDDLAHGRALFGAAP